MRFRSVAAALLFIGTQICAGCAPIQQGLRIDHIAVGVTDLSATVAWYRDKLGFVEDGAYNLADLGAEAAFVRRGDFRIEIFQIRGTGPMAAYRKDPVEDLRHGGFSHIAFSVDDVSAFVEELKQKGVDIAAPVTEYVAGVPVAFIRDIAGNLIEIYPRSAISKPRSAINKTPRRAPLGQTGNKGKS